MIYYSTKFSHRRFFLINTYKNKKLVVIGAGVSGQGLAILAAKKGAEVFVTEKNSIPDEVKNTFTQNNIHFEEKGHSEKFFDNADEILISAGLRPDTEIFKRAQNSGVKITGELDFVMPDIKAEKIICITGSNGKSTVTSLTGHILSKLNLKTGTGGNLGTASAKFTQENFNAVVLELSSFQLERAKNNLRSSVSIITNLAPDHIDWHGSYENYVKAKAKILSLRNSDGWGIIQDNDANLISKLDKNALNGKIITLSHNENPLNKFSGHIFMDSDKAFLIMNGEKICLFNYSDTDLIGGHNFENVAMSLTACRLAFPEYEKDFNAPKNLLAGFKALPHRCERAGEFNGVLYIDDSKGTNVAASNTAMKSIKMPKIIILGGQGKGEDYAPLAEVVKAECKHAVLIGEEAEKINAALKNSGFKNIHMAKSMKEAVKISSELAKPGMCVLLSPACTSWDMYKSYKIRGEDFCNCVREIANS